MNKPGAVTPFVKWVGGKRQLISEVEKYFPQHYATYYEPFIGGGAVLFHFLPKNAVINDTNAELVNLYRVVRDDVEALIEDLKYHHNDADYFYALRAIDRSDAYADLSAVEKASRLHYLNKTCFNGLFRVNRAGQFNTPFGRYKNPNIINQSVLTAVSHYLNQAQVKILNTDYQNALKGIAKNDFVYFDPPYDPISSSSNFTAYTQDGFDRNAQQRLKQTCDSLHQQGIRFLLSNSATDFIKDLYRDYDVHIVQAKRHINSKGHKRGLIDEVFVKNY
ncbi:DNA adenine methylase [Candidatus Venteria ishoeyi]|uniref:Site-specific DNA-methyltransferase (adenine-specific) n=1 Tax=Candidatus Venteria ishoeyi TaxID=1899563 RepID=A0A1H6FEA7_9GAMM|nr:DNA adenine methylase [Candidatus Venteria ishoeyi]SEH08420.1 Modification methylase DpnIIA [Candidatus Venteria ishoeyi]